jgi:hypothetical protein
MLSFAIVCLAPSLNIKPTWHATYDATLAERRSDLIGLAGQKKPPYVRRHNIIRDGLHAQLAICVCVHNVNLCVRQLNSLVQEFIEFICNRKFWQQRTTSAVLPYIDCHSYCGTPWFNSLPSTRLSSYRFFVLVIITARQVSEPNLKQPRTSPPQMIVQNYHDWPLLNQSSIH